MPKELPDTSSMIQYLEEQGFTVKKDATYKKRTFEVDEEIYRTFRVLQEAKGMKIKEAFNEALSEWVERHKDGVTIPESSPIDEAEEDEG